MPRVAKSPVFIVTVTRPVLTPEERAKRMERIKQAAARLILETQKTKLQNNRRTS